MDIDIERTGRLPQGTVTFLFTDIQGSTRLWQEYPQSMPTALTRHHSILRNAIETYDGYVFQIVGDAFCAAFHTALNALKASIYAQRLLSSEAWGETGPLRVRMALHSGGAELRAGDFTSGEYVSGLTLSRTARLLSAGHGGQVLLSRTTRDLLIYELPDSVNLLDLGEHSLKDLSLPEHIFQVCSADMPAEFPPLRTLDSQRTNLPLSATRLIGRIEELTEIRERLKRSEVRLLTLSGFGGIGKTRLALQTAADSLDDFPDGAYFFDLALVSNGELMLQAIISVLGISENSAGTPEQSLISALRLQRKLLVFDNCEQIVEACAELTHRLITNCQNLKILATSRLPLGVPGEILYAVQPLPVPDARLLTDLSAFAQVEAVNLFIERAKSIRMDFALTSANAGSIGEICIRLEGIPLAIELAAARVNMLSAEQIASRLNDSLRLLSGGSRVLHSRQQTLRGILDWSYALLPSDEQILFRRLGIFSGSWDLEATENICAETEEEVVDLLSNLVNHSLVNVEEREGQLRYRMLEVVRQYARERLSGSGEELEIQLRHIDYYRGLVERAERQFLSPEQSIWFNLLEIEADNIRWALENASTSSILAGSGMVVRLWYFWVVRWYLSEGLTWSKRYLEILGDTLDHRRIKTDLFARAAWFAALLVGHQNDIELADRSLEMAYELDDDRRIAFALYLKGALERNKGNAQSALDFLEKGLAFYRKVNDDWGIARCLYSLGIVYQYYYSNREIAYRYNRESLEKFRQAGDQRGASLAINNLGGLALDEGDLETANRYFEESLSISRQVGDRRNIASWLGNLGHVALKMGNTKEARTYIEESYFLNSKEGNLIISDIEIMWEMGILERLEGEYLLARDKLNQALLTSRENEYNIHIVAILSELGKVECLLDNHRQAALYLEDAISTGSELSISDVEYLYTLEAVILLAVEHQLEGKAARLLGAVDNYLENQKIRRDPVRQAEIEPIKQISRTRMGETAFSEAFQQGQTLPLEQALKEAQDLLRFIANE